jgi:hypothetical protein
VSTEHFRAWKRTALVTDIPWIEHVTTLFGWMTRAGQALPRLAQRADAIAWAAA